MSKPETPAPLSLSETEWSTNVYGRHDGIVRLVFKATDADTLIPHLGAEVTLRLVKVVREDVEA